MLKWLFGGNSEALRSCAHYWKNTMLKSLWGSPGVVIKVFLFAVLCLAVSGTCIPLSGLADESGSGQPEGMDLVVCRAPGGEFYVEGETWQLDECTRCTCRKGRVLCDTEVCPPALCPAPARNKDTCCYVCPGVYRFLHAPILTAVAKRHSQSPLCSVL